MNLNSFYYKLLKYPKLILLSVLFFVVLLGSFSLKVEIDASSETLLLKDDKDLVFSREVNKVYGSSDYLVVTYTPKSELLSDETLSGISKLSSDLLELDAVASINSILNVPLLKNSSQSIADLLQHIPTLEDGADRELAKKEFLSSALYKKHLVSSDFKTTALLLNLKEDTEYLKLLHKRNALALRDENSSLSEEDLLELKKVSLEFKKNRDAARGKNHETIKEIRNIIKQHRGNDELFLGGVNMITDDMISFVRSDLKVYGTIIILFIILILWKIFGQWRFIILSISILFLSVLAMTGILGLFGLEVTVISSNFVSLQMIITMSLVMHLSIKYKEVLLSLPHAAHKEIIVKSTASMFKPSFYVILTTIVGFGSLVASGIVPVIDLGWMMSGGVFISLIITFILFPTIMILFPKMKIDTHKKDEFLLTGKLADIVASYKKSIIVVTLLLVAFSISGSKFLIVENSFIDYFKKDTEIYRGMYVIDKQLGGTTPLDVIIDFPAPIVEESAVEEFDEFDEFEDELASSENEEQYWFTENKMTQIEAIHDYLDSLPAVGKVLSLATTIKVARSVNDGKDLDSVAYAYIYNELPNKYKDILLKPYLDLQNNQVRFTVRIIDSMKDLRRDELLKRIQREIHEKLGVPKENIRLANMMVMYNNMLQSLFNSQIKTLGIVLLSLFVMFLILFKSFKVAIIASMVNIIPVGVIFGFMGWFALPLDMMTITIAAISLGIAVDNTIHYLYRFKQEYKKDNNYLASMHRAHATIGSAMYYTSMIIMFGFSVLALSSFYPTIHFGLLIMLAMFMAVIADLLLLPMLIVLIKPFKS